MAQALFNIQVLWFQLKLPKLKGWFLYNPIITFFILDFIMIALQFRPNDYKLKINWAYSNMKDINKREHYDSISTDTRRLLIKLTQQDGISIRKASKALCIKYSTGKTLVQLYKRTGRIDRVKQQRAPTCDKKN